MMRKIILLPNLLKKFLIFLCFLLSLFIIHYSLFIRPTKAQDSPVPPPFVSCNQTGSPEFHSLRPYQSSPCQTNLGESAKFCGNTLVLKDTITETYVPGSSNCQSINGKINCTYNISVSKPITIDLSGANLPIMGNTEDVVNYKNETDTLDNAQKVNDYVSWYLSGVTYKKEYGVPDVTDKNQDSDFVNYAGPVAKLLPQEIQLATRINTIERSLGKDVNNDNKTPQQDRHNQKVVCTKEIEIPLIGLKIGKTNPTECPHGISLGAQYRLSDWDGNLSFLTNVLNTVLGTYGGIAGFFAKILPNYRLDDIKEYLIKSEAWNKRVPPLSWNFEDQLLYKKAYNEWRGKSCILVPVPTRFLICIDSFLIPNKYADLFSYVPLSSTEDLKGSISIDSQSLAASTNSEISVTNVSLTGQTPADLFFSHIQEADEMGSLLQDTFVGKDQDKIGNPTNISQDTSCKTVEVRSNKGDNLFAKQITGTLSYKATFSCDFNPITTPDNSLCFRNCLAEGKFPSECGSLCSVPVETKISTTQTCSKDVYINLSTTSNTPKVDDLWSRLVAGPSAIFKRIFPKTNTEGGLGQVMDIAGATNITYSGEGISSSDTDLKLPHIGGISEYFLKGIQTILRPKGFGESITLAASTTCEGGDTSTPKMVPAQGSCNLGKNNLNLPPTFIEVVETAAETFKVPPSLIIGVIYGEGGFERYQITEENIKNWINNCAKIPNCTSGAQSNGLAPFFAIYWPQISKAIKEHFPERNPDPCNLFDSVLGVAWSLADGVRGNAVFTGKSCFGINLNTSGTIQKDSCSWTNSDIETAIKTWESGYEINCFTKKGGCFKGNRAGQCTESGAANIDICEKYNNYSTSPSEISHNACIWDVYVKNK